MTAISLLAFAEAKIDLAILETGLGGRLDATTAANAEIAAITPIDLDHQEYLGDTIEQVAAEKAAIIHGGTGSVVIGRQRPKALAVLEERIKEILPTRPNVRECAVTFDESSLGNPIRTLTSEIGLRGEHQVQNAEVAILLAGVLRKHFPITDDDIRHGLKSANHPGRLEYVGRFLLDGAHNLAGAKALRKFIKFNEKRPITLIFGAMNDKNVGEMLAETASLARLIILTQPSNSRSLSSEELLQFMPSEISREIIHAAETVADAIVLATENTPEDGIILVTGSLYLVGEVMAKLSREPGSCREL
jgi:dihydrofolate synthase / folylpolyglutamate synthase